MPTLRLRETSFTFSSLPTEKDADTARIKIEIQNEIFSYCDIEEVPYADLESLITSLSRLLAGGYEREYSLLLENVGVAVDLYAYTEDGRPVSRRERREKDCVAILRILFRSPTTLAFLDGVYSLMLRREEIEIFVEGLRKEYEENIAQRIPGKGKYLFVGVSPMGYTGCNYLYLDPTGRTRKGEYVWVRMGRHNREQVVFVDSVRYYDDEDAPYNPKTVKQVLRAATQEEIEKNSE